MPLQNQLNKLAVAVEDDLTTTSVISNISEGADGATSFMYEAEYDEIEIEDAQNIPFKAMHGITAIGLATASIDTADLLALNDRDKKAYIASIGVDMALVSLDPISIEFLDHPDSGNFWRFYATVASVPYRERATGRRGAGLHVGGNILSLYAWEDTDSNGVADGWTSAGFESTTFSAGVQSLSKDDDGADGTLTFEEFFFPFNGEEIVLSADITNLVTGGHTTKLVLTFKDSSDSVISTEETQFSSNGRKSVIANIPDNTVNIEVSIQAVDDGSTGTTSFDVADPALRVDGKETYIKH